MRCLNPVLLTVCLLLLSGAGVAAVLLPAETAPAGGVPEDAPADAHGADTGGHGHGSGAHTWKAGKGEIPTLADALTKLDRRARIDIAGDDAFNPANGVRSGSGTFDDPFVIEGWYVDVIHVRDTTKAFVVRNSYVVEIMVLDWTGPGGHVHHNHVNNLRTNRNVERTGDPSATVIEQNTILRVQELRHFDGELRNNTIGRADRVGSLLQPQVVLNIAGLNGAGIHHNIIHGGVDMKLHGHHHSDAPGLASHNHGTGQSDTTTHADGLRDDHTVRHIDFRFENNRIVDDGFGMRYNDLNHAGDDRQATSEQNVELEKPHVHHSRIVIAHNVIEGATLRVAAVNALDERHLGGESATLVVRANRVVQPAAGDGLVVQDVRNATVRLEGNTVEKGSLQLAGASGILMQRFWNATVEVVGNSLGDYRYGVRAAQFDEATTWSVRANRAPGAEHAVYWDDSVAHPPQEAEAPHDHAGHEHEEATPDLRRRSLPLLSP